MFLEKIEIKNYKSITELDWTLNEKLSCLVGQNESGKSNLLELFDYVEPKNSKILHYTKHTSRSSNEYINQELPKLRYTYKIHIPVITELFTLFKKNNVNTDEIPLKEYGNYYIIEVDEKQPNLQTEYFLFNNKKIEIKGLKVNGPPPPPQATGVRRNHVAINQAKINEILLFINKNKTNIIKLEDDFKISYEASIESLKNGTSKNTTLFRLMIIAGLKDPSKIPNKKAQLKQYLKRLNKDLNNNFIKKYYSQDESVKMEFTHDSGLISLEIEDNTESSYEMEERSDGFKYFFSLLVEMASHQEGNGDSIFLLDEPGAKLHPSGQRDLLKYLEELSEKHRIIYTTHSPFLINRLYPNRVKIVERNHEKGTIFKYKGFSKNWKPMRSSLGLNIKDSFYYSDKALIVEGPEDLIFISSLINYFNVNREISLNTDLFSFIDAGGESNLPAMVQIIMDDERPTLVLIDSDSQSTFNKLSKKVSKVNDESILDLIQVNEYKKEAVSIEDLLPYQLLESAVLNYCSELVDDEVLELKVSSSFDPIDLSKTSSSRYNASISSFVKKYYKEVDLDEDLWSKKKTPISKVGIARHFELLLVVDEIDKSKLDFKPILKLIKTIATKLGLLS